MPMRRTRHAKIVATLGPASSSPEMIRALFETGADVFRFNFSHGSHEEHQKRYDIVRAIEQETGRPIAVLADLQGPKLRVGRLADGPIALDQGDRIRFDLDPAPGTRARIPLPHPEVFAALEPGVHLLIDDGKVRLEVEAATPSSAVARVLIGGPLSERKGVSVVGAVLPVSAITEKDRRDLAFALDMGADWIALSFVQRPQDLDELRELAGRPVSVITKLEKPSAVEQLEAVVARSDAVMVARGDLGVEMPPQKVPPIQRQVLRGCRKAGKPVIVATQMLESMIEAPTPTRAEASDVATAVYEGADAVMLSAETAVGRYPVEAAAMMNRIACRVQQDPLYFATLEANRLPAEHTNPDAISAAACQVAATVGAAAIVSFTSSGATALRAARERPGAPILVLTPNLPVARRLALLWGAHCVHLADIRNFNDMVQKAVRTAHDEDIAGPGQRVVITAGVPFGTPGSTNVLRIAWVER